MHWTMNAMHRSEYLEQNCLCCRGSSVARKSRAARKIGSSDTPVLRTGNSPCRTIPSAVMPLNSHHPAILLPAQACAGGIQILGGGLGWAAMGGRRRRGGRLEAEFGAVRMCAVVAHANPITLAGSPLYHGHRTSGDALVSVSVALPTRAPAAFRYSDLIDIFGGTPSMERWSCSVSEARRSPWAGL